MAMRLARIAGVKTVPHGLVKIHDEYAYITRRIDRLIDGDSVELYAMEDFCQLSGRLTLDKYKASYEICGKIINAYSVNRGFDLSEQDGIPFLWISAAKASSAPQELSILYLPSSLLTDLIPLLSHLK